MYGKATQRQNALEGSAVIAAGRKDAGIRAHKDCNGLHISEYIAREATGLQGRDAPITSLYP